MTLVVEPVVGKDCKLYYNTGTDAVPVWVEATAAINVSASLGKGEADVSARFSGWQLSKGGLKQLEITFTYRHLRLTDTVFDALMAAYIAGTAIQFAVLDADVTESGAQGPKAFCEVMQMNVAQELENGQEYDVTLKPTYYEETGALVEPSWHETP